MFFTDSGPFGETSISNCNGSVFMINLEDQILCPIALNCLAYPSGLVLDKNEDVLFVCETLRNRVLKFYVGEEGNFIFTVFHQFSGRLGPLAISRNNDDYVFVARFEFFKFSKEGLISVFNQKGVITQNIVLPGYPEINGMQFSKINHNVLLLTENSVNPVCIRVLISDVDADKEDKNEDFVKFN